MTTVIGFIGATFLNVTLEFREELQLFWEMLKALWLQIVNRRFRFHEAIEQSYLIGVQSVPVLVFSLTFVSVICVLEFSYHVKLILQQDSLVAPFSTVIMVRELGPVITAMLLTSRVGAGIAAEIGTMQTTEQLDALRLLSIDPVGYLTIPRWFACVLACASLSIISLGVGMLGGAYIAAASLGHSSGEYFNTMFVFTRFHDFQACLLKAVVFGTIIPLVACYQGFHCKAGSEGVGNASTAAVVQGAVFIIVADFVLTYLVYAL